MATIGLFQTPYRILRDMQGDMAALWVPVASRARAQVISASGADGKIDPTRKRALRLALGRLVEDTFDGEYTALLNRYLVRAIQDATAPHTAFMRRVMPADLQARLGMITRVSEQGPGENSAADIEDAKKRIRIFNPNLLAQYEAPHAWVDPDGYRLSDRIWNGSQRTRIKIDRIITHSINTGMSALDLADLLEFALVPARRGVRTSKPYGEDIQGRVSFDAMRLARSEITRAHSQAAKAAALANPYVTTMDYALSASHPKIDICDTLAAGSPYPVEDTPVPVQDSHPQCLCTIRPRVGESLSDITAQLRAVVESAEADLAAALTPLQGEAFNNQLFDTVLRAVVGRLPGAAQALGL